MEVWEENIYLSGPNHQHCTGWWLAVAEEWLMGNHVACQLRPNLLAGLSKIILSSLLIATVSELYSPTSISHQQRATLLG